MCYKVLFGLTNVDRSKFFISHLQAPQLATVTSQLLKTQSYNIHYHFFSHWNSLPQDVIDFSLMVKSKSVPRLTSCLGQLSVFHVMRTLLSSQSLKVLVWLTSNALVSINIVTLHQAWLVPGWVTVFTLHFLTWPK